MKSLRKFAHLRSVDQLLLIKVLFLVVIIRLGLWLLPFRTVRQFLVSRKNAKAVPANTGSPTMSRIIWSIEAAGRRVPRATCLVQALAAEVLLRRLGVPVQMRLGVARGDDGQFLAHAWLEDRGNIVIGRLAEHTRFCTLSYPEY